MIQKTIIGMEPIPCCTAIKTQAFCDRQFDGGEYVGAQQGGRIHTDELIHVGRHAKDDSPPVAERLELCLATDRDFTEEEVDDCKPEVAN